MRTASFDYALPPELIALRPRPQRDRSRLLVLDRANGRLVHRPCFRDLVEELNPGDLLVLNDSRVFPARLRGHKERTGGEIELLLLTEVASNDWWAMVRPGKRIRSGTRLVFSSPNSGASLEAAAVEKNSEGHWRVQFSGARNVRELLEDFGEMPLPPYIDRPLEAADRERYQTVFARSSGSVAAPTAGLHFTEDLLARLRAHAIGIAFVTLHVGLGTFAPVKAEEVTEHTMHEEHFTISDATARAIDAAKQSGRRVIAVGTTTVRVLESVAARHGGRVIGTEGRTRIFIYPPFRFQVVDALLTNFHLPRSSLLMLVSAFAAPGGTSGRELILRAYAEAIRERYRFFSYGDAMLIR